MVSDWKCATEWRCKKKKILFVFSVNLLFSLTVFPFSLLKAVAALTIYVDVLDQRQAGRNCRSKIVEHVHENGQQQHCSKY